MKVTDITYEYPKYLGEFRGQEKLAIKATIEENDDPKECINKVKEMVCEGLGINGVLSSPARVSNGDSNGATSEAKATSGHVSNGEGEKDGEKHAAASVSDEGSKEVHGDTVAEAKPSRKPRGARSARAATGQAVGVTPPVAPAENAADTQAQEVAEPSDPVAPKQEAIKFDREVADHRKLLSMELMSIIEPKYGKEANKNEKVKTFVPKIVTECLGRDFASLVSNRLTVLPEFKVYLRSLYEKHDK